jgi:hypothetical protein
VNSSLGIGVPDDADGLARALPSAGVGLGALSPDWQAPQVANSSVTLDGLESLKVHPQFAAQVAFDNILAILNGMDDLRDLLLVEGLGSKTRVNLRVLQDALGIHRTNPIEIPPCYVDPLVPGDIYT